MSQDFKGGSADVWVASMHSCYPRRPSSRDHLGLWIYLEAPLCQLLLSETLLGDALPWEPVPSNYWELTDFLSDLSSL